MKPDPSVAITACIPRPGNQGARFPTHLAFQIASHPPTIPISAISQLELGIATRRHTPSPAMAAVASTAGVASPCLLQRPLATPAALRASARPVSGLPALRMRKIVCSAEKKEGAQAAAEGKGLPQLAAAVTSAATVAYAHPVLALVDERLSTEGTGLGLGVSNSNLTWILVGVTSLIWALYFTYSSKLVDGGDDSGLDL